MKLTPRAQGYRWKRPKWDATKWYDVRTVGKTVVKVIDQFGRVLYFDRNDEDTDWERICSTPKKKRT